MAHASVADARQTPEPAPPTDVVLLTCREAARQAGVSLPTLNGWIRSGYLPVEQKKRRRVIRQSDLAVAQSLVHAGVVVPLWRQDPSRAGRRLRALREAAGFSQLDLAAASGLTHEAISRLELGQRTPLAESVWQLTHALGVPSEQFIAQDPIGLSTLSVAEAAHRLDVPESRIRSWLKANLLEGSKVAGRWLVPAIAVAELGQSGRLRGRSHRLDPRYRGYG